MRPKSRKSVVRMCGIEALNKKKEVSPEKRLWLSVLVQSLQDAETVRDFQYRVDESKVIKDNYLKRQGISGIKGLKFDLLRFLESDNLSVACEVTGIEESYIRDHILKRINSQ